MRLRAVEAVESGVHPEDVAASLGMARGTVYGWLASSARVVRTCCGRGRGRVVRRS